MFKELWIFLAQNVTDTRTSICLTHSSISICHLPSYFVAGLQQRRGFLEESGKKRLVGEISSDEDGFGFREISLLTRQLLVQFHPPQPKSPQNVTVRMSSKSLDQQIWPRCPASGGSRCVRVQPEGAPSCAPRCCLLRRLRATDVRRLEGRKRRAAPPSIDVGGAPSVLQCSWIIFRSRTTRKIPLVVERIWGGQKCWWRWKRLLMLVQMWLEHI